VPAIRATRPAARIVTDRQTKKLMERKEEVDEEYGSVSSIA
jgi:hypothetical protein